MLRNSLLFIVYRKHGRNRATSTCWRNTHIRYSRNFSLYSSFPIPSHLNNFQLDAYWNVVVQRALNSALRLVFLTARAASASRLEYVHREVYISSLAVRNLYFWRKNTPAAFVLYVVGFVKMWRFGTIILGLQFWTVSIVMVPVPFRFTFISSRCVFFLVGSVSSDAVGIMTICFPIFTAWVDINLVDLLDRIRTG